MAQPTCWDENDERRLLSSHKPGGHMAKKAAKKAAKKTAKKR
jgi:hypothetical protein